MGSKFQIWLCCRYFFSIPYLLWRTPFPTILRYLAEKLILLVWINLGTYNTIYHSCRLFLFCFCSLLLFAGIEFCWNVYPSNMYSSILLLSLHLILLWGLWSGPAEYPYVHSKASDRKQKWKNTNSSFFLLRSGLGWYRMATGQLWVVERQIWG